MKIRNKRNGTNTLVYRVNGLPKTDIILAGSVVNLVTLINFNQIINKQDFKRGWFEIVEENIEIKEEIEKKDNILDKAKKQAEEYSEEK
jgi:hypothetical protein